MLAAHAVGGLGRDLLHGRVGQPAHDVEVMRAEVLDDPHVAYAVGERAHALGGDQEDLAELTLVHPPPRLHQRRVEALDVADGAEHAGGGTGVDDRLAVLQRAGQRLLHEHVHPRRRQRLRGGAVLIRRHGEDREVERSRREQRVEVGVDHPGVVHGVVAITTRVDGAGELDLRVHLEEASVVAADHAQAGDRATQRSAHGAQG